MNFLDGIIEGYMPALNNLGRQCDHRYRGLMGKLDQIRIGIDRAGNDPADERNYVAVPIPAGGLVDQRITQVPPGQQWVLEVVTLNIALAATGQVLIHTGTGATGARWAAYMPNGQSLPGNHIVFPAGSTIYWSVLNMSGAGELFLQFRVMVPSNIAPPDELSDHAPSLGRKDGLISNANPEHELARDEPIPEHVPPFLAVPQR